MQNSPKSFYLSIILAFSCLTIFAQVPKSGRVVWLKVDAGIGLDAKGNIKTWADQSGNKYSASQATVSLRPKYIKRGANGMPCVRFDGKDDYMSCPSKFPVNRGFTIITVVRINNYSGVNAIVAGNSAYAFWGLGSNKPSLWYNGLSAVTSSKAIPTNFCAISTVVDTVTKKADMYINDSLAGTSRDTMQNTDNGINIGSFNSYYPLDGDVSEVLIFNRPLLRAEVDSINFYLNNKYLLTGSNGNISMSQVPNYFQFYPRDASDSATVKFRGNVVKSGYDTANLMVYKNDTLWKTYSSPLSYASGVAALNFDSRIKAELSEYNFSIHLKNSTTDTAVFYQSNIVAGDVYVVNGQSNSIASSSLSDYSNDFVRSFGSNTAFSDGDPADTFWGRATGANFVNYAAGSWGIVLGQRLKEKEKIPICILNQGVGGTPVQFHLRDDSNPENQSTSYGRLLYRMRKAGIDKGLKAILWYQGESNSLPGYSYAYHTLYNSWKKDYPNIAHLYIVQIHTGCGGGNQMREELRGLADTIPNASAMSTGNLPSHDGCHYYLNGVIDGYDSLGLHLYRLVEKDFYHSTDTLNIAPPNIKKAFYSSANYREISILFREKNAGLKWTRDTSILDLTNNYFKFNIRHAFYLDKNFGHVSKVSVSGDTLKLSLDTNTRFSRMTYIPDTYYENTYSVYEGPWLVNKRGIGALTFDNFPIDTFIPPTHAALAFNVDSICIGAPTNFTDKSTLGLGNILTYKWDFGDSSNSILQNPVHMYKATGYYNVKLSTYNSTGVRDSLTKTILIDSIPNAHFTMSSNNGFTYTFTPVDTNLYSYSWDFGDGGLSNRMIKKYSYTDAGKYNITLSVRNISNCRNSWTDSINILLTKVNSFSNDGIKLRVSPNPFSESSVLNYSLEKNTSLNVVLFDAAGKMVAKLYEGIQTSGQHSLTIDANTLNLPKGIYQLLFISGEGKIVKKIVRI